MSADDYMAIPCRLLLNGTVECQRYVYTSVDEWKAQRDRIDRVLHAYRRRILHLKVPCVHCTSSDIALCVSIKAAMIYIVATVDTAVLHSLSITAIAPL